MTQERTSGNPVHVLSVGAFGQAVAQYLRTFQPDILQTTLVNGELPGSDVDQGGRITVVAAWRPVPNICEFFDGLSHRWRRPFVSLILDSNVLRLGPIVVPGLGGCWNCWHKRFLQHAPWPNEQSEMLRFYASNAEIGPAGYLEPFAMIGATRVSHFIDALDSSTATPGQVWQMDIMTREIRTTTVIGVHNCPRCGLHRPLPTSTFSEMQAELAHLWYHPAAKGQ